MNIFNYYGTIWSTCEEPSKSGVDIILYDPAQEHTKAPVRITAYGGLAEYVKNLISTDDEEKYMNAFWFYDSNLFLHKIVYYDLTARKILKVVTTDSPFAKECTFFGSKEFLNTKEPEPLDTKTVEAYIAFERTAERVSNLADFF